jgi:branched-chain amino acid aminotransferase
MFLNTHFPKAKFYWYEGKLYDWSQAVLHPMSHGLHYGTSVFEGIRAYSTARGPAIFRLPEHNDRLFHSASVLKMTVPYTKVAVVAAIKQTMRENPLEAAYIRPLLFYSYGNLGLVPKASPVELTIGCWEWDAYLGEKSLQGACVYILPWRRVHHSQLQMTAKLGGVYVQSTICGLEARAQGCDEAVFLNLEGRIAEGPGQNIFIVTDGVLRTNDKSESVLEGITRTSILEIARDLGHKTKVGPIRKEEFFAADEAFFTGTAVEVIPIVRVRDASDPNQTVKDAVIGDGRPGPVTLEMTKAYKDIVGGRNKAYERWLTYIRD